MSKVRLVAVTVAPQLVNDDGDQLHPLQVEPLVVPAADWPPDLDTFLANIDQQLNPPGDPARALADPGIT